jgi:tyrosinase
MAVLRSNILASPHAETFLDSVVGLSQLPTGITPAQLNQSVPAAAPDARIFGTATEMNRALSWWDLFTWWHVAAMSWPTGGGNRAHRGPVFLPWHRLFLRRLEEAVQAVSGDPSAALPYWAWNEDGELPAAMQFNAALWSLVGPARGQVTQGPLAQLRVRLFQNVADGRLYVGPPRRIWRDAARAVPGLPDSTDQAWTLADGLFDRPNWNEAADSFRNKLEGFQDPREDRSPRTAPWMHNRVHVWVAGEMGPGSSPNDPVFWLNHCNVDRLWEAWMRRRGRAYVPGPGQGPPGHRANDPLFSIVWDSMTPSQVLDPTESGLDWYRYDALPT